jgi:hypothetical protein
MERALVPPVTRTKIGFVEDIQEVLAVLVSRPVVCHAVGERTGVNSALGIAPTTKVSSSKPHRRHDRPALPTSGPTAEAVELRPNLLAL